MSCESHFRGIALFAAHLFQHSSLVQQWHLFKLSNHILLSSSQRWCCEAKQHLVSTQPMRLRSLRASNTNLLSLQQRLEQRHAMRGPWLPPLPVLQHVHRKYQLVLPVVSAETAKLGGLHRH